MPDTSTPIGTWYLKTWYPSRPDLPAISDADVRRMLWPVRMTLLNPGLLPSVMAEDTSRSLFLPSWTIDQLEWNPETRLVTFRQVMSPSTCRWHRGRIVEGVNVGRFTNTVSSTEAPLTFSLTTYPCHMRGWSASYLDRDNPSIAFEIVIEDGAPDLPDSAYLFDVWRGEDNQSSIPRKRLATIRFEQFVDRLEGRFKIFGWPRFNTDPFEPRYRGAYWVQRIGEEIEYDLTEVSRTGNDVRFTRRAPNGAWREDYVGTIYRRWIEGTCTRTYAGDPRPARTTSWRGTRTRVLTYGLQPKTTEARERWQERTRARLEHLLIGHVRVVGTRYHVGAALSSEPPPVSFPRDDRTPATTGTPGMPGMPGRFVDGTERSYTFRELHLEYDLTFDDLPGAPRAMHTRRIHGFVSVPNEAPPLNGFPIAVALNGHGGSAFIAFRPGEDAARFLMPREESIVRGPNGECRRVPIYSRCSGAPSSDPGDYFGDAFARRGYVVLSVDIGHRGYRPAPVRGTPCGNSSREDFVRQNVYESFGGHLFGIHESSAGGWGDDLLNGNGYHPWIAPTGAERFPASSDWVEDGERVWDVRRALSFLQDQGREDHTEINGGRQLRIDDHCIALMGLSLGGETATIAAALDTRFTVAIPAGWAPDMGLFSQAAANHPCGQWVYAEMAEYVDVSDYHAMVAPRGLILQTQYQDNTYSWVLAAVDGLPARPHFSSDKENFRRGRVAFHDAQHRYVHFIHEFQIGGATHTFAIQDVRTQRFTGPLADAEGSLVTPFHAWQSDRNSVEIRGPGDFRVGPHPTLFQVVAAFCNDYGRIASVITFLQKHRMLDKYWSTEKVLDLKDYRELVESPTDESLIVPSTQVVQSTGLRRSFIPPSERPLEMHGNFINNVNDHGQMKDG